MESLTALGGLIRVRNVVDAEIARVIGRPAHPGHIAEYVASIIFDIELHASASAKATDGLFRSGPLAGRSVNIKYGSRRDGLLNLVQSGNVDHHPEIYLVLTGPNATAMSSKGLSAPWVIDQVYVFESADLVPTLVSSGRIPGTAVSVRKEIWAKAQLFPTASSKLYLLSDSQREALEILGSIPVV